MSDYGAKSKKYAEAIQWRDWQTCDLIVEEHESLLVEIQKLKADREIMIAALKFYASWKSWDHSDHPYHEMFLGLIKDDESSVKYTEADGEQYESLFGGKRARQALKSIGEIE